VTPSVLLVDLARLGSASFRPLNVWASSLAKLIPDDCPFLALAVTVADLHHVDIPLEYALRSNTSAAQQLLVKSLFDDLNGADGGGLGGRTLPSSSRRSGDQPVAVGPQLAPRLEAVLGLLLDPRERVRPTPLYNTWDSVFSRGSCSLLPEPLTPTPDS
jgi:hypothetical protein